MILKVLKNTGSRTEPATTVAGCSIERFTVINNNGIQTVEFSEVRKPKIFTRTPDIFSSGSIEINDDITLIQISDAEKIIYEYYGRS